MKNIILFSVKCGKGYELTADGCKNCTWNTYKSSPGNDACTPCPSGTHTWSKGAKSIHECISKIFYIFFQFLTLIMINNVFLFYLTMNY